MSLLLAAGLRFIKKIGNGSSVFHSLCFKYYVLIHGEQIWSALIVWSDAGVSVLHGKHDPASSGEYGELCFYCACI